MATQGPPAGQPATAAGGEDYLDKGEHIFALLHDVFANRSKALDSVEKQAGKMTGHNIDSAK